MDYCIDKSLKTHEKGTKNGVRENLRVKASSLYSKYFSANNRKSRLKTQGDREFQALSEYIITFLKI